MQAKSKKEFARGRRVLALPSIRRLHVALRGVALTSLMFASVALAAPKYKVLHAFGAGSDGAAVWGGVTLDPEGNIYGTTGAGGAHRGGVAFKLTPRTGGAWDERILHNFNSRPRDGATPLGGVIRGRSGTLYGTTQTGGDYVYGTVFKLAPSAHRWTEQVLYSFGSHGGYGGEPTAGVVMDGAGNLYGTARTMAFELTPSTDGWKETVLHRFGIKKDDGAGLYAGVILDGAGNLYGTTGGGGIGCAGEGCGVVYEIERAASGWKEKILHYFDNNGRDGVEPGWGALFMDVSGKLYGTTSGGGTYFCGGAQGTTDQLEARQPPGRKIGNCGTIFMLTKDAAGRWKEAVLHSFKSGPTGSSPNAGVVMDKAGVLYGTTDYGGQEGCGVIYQLAPTGKDKWSYTVLHTFSGYDGCLPEGNLVLDRKGNLYGGTVLGGSTGNGVIFELTP